MVTQEASCKFQNARSRSLATFGATLPSDQGCMTSGLPQQTDGHSIVAIPRCHFPCKEFHRTRFDELFRRLSLAAWRSGPSYKKAQHVFHHRLGAYRKAQQVTHFVQDTTTVWSFVSTLDARNVFISTGSNRAGTVHAVALRT
ncbi:hypothetical protein PsorP6_000666 [Peronosclerospora sorghi]|uniref:Uncharacterized protein n=1 Tax=Peronosclerospora sorghi TaxID=230839 RepID=A0ACC0WXN3_9STRA|nr:hypothetical protein PsorP6_000666 [Peronosclerospora sorghi]